MAKGRLIASAGSKEDLEKLINKYYYSENYIITENNEVYNKKLNKTFTDIRVILKKERWRLESILS